MKKIDKLEEFIIQKLRTERGLEHGIKLMDLDDVVHTGKIDTRMAIRQYRENRIRGLIRWLRQRYPEITIKDRKIFIPESISELMKKSAYHIANVEGRINSNNKFMKKNMDYYDMEGQQMIKDLQHYAITELVKRIKQHNAEMYV